jgi:hypothetical protein
LFLVWYQLFCSGLLYQEVQEVNSSSVICHYLQCVIQVHEKHLMVCDMK